MLKKGFTLLEILLTLGIIGVISMLTLPTLMNNTRRNEVGPKLAKAVAVFEQANQLILNQYKTSSFINFNSENGTELITELTNHIKMAEIESYAPIYLGNSEKINKASVCHFKDYDPNNASFYLTKDGIVYIIEHEKISNLTTNAIKYLKDPYKKPMGKVIIDINGQAEPNRTGTDIFEFHWLFNGNLVAYGSNEAASKIEGVNENCYWNNVTLELCPANKYARDTRACAGHIMENNLKLDYIY